MAKYIIDVPDNTQWIQWVNVSEKDGHAYFDYKAPEDLVPYVKSESYIDGFKKGQNEVWEFARRIICPSDCCEDSISAHTKEIFNKEGWEIRGIFNDLSYQEAEAKYEEWRKSKDKIRVGDEVEQITASGNPVGLKCVVTKIVDDEILKGITQTGEVVTCSSQIKRWWRKTGRHFSEAERLLEALKVK